jgi:hypothetical protein
MQKPPFIQCSGLTPIAPGFMMPSSVVCVCVGLWCVLVILCAAPAQMPPLSSFVRDAMRYSNIDRWTQPTA